MIYLLFSFCSYVYNLGGKIMIYFQPWRISVFENLNGTVETSSHQQKNFCVKKRILTFLFFFQVYDHWKDIDFGEFFSTLCEEYALQIGSIPQISGCTRTKTPIWNHLAIVWADHPPLKNMGSHVLFYCRVLWELRGVHNIFRRRDLNLRINAVIQYLKTHRINGTGIFAVVCAGKISKHGSYAKTVAEAYVFWRTTLSPKTFHGKKSNVLFQTSWSCIKTKYHQIYSEQQRHIWS